jgi:hypothetical protein
MVTEFLLVQIGGLQRHQEAKMGRDFLAPAAAYPRSNENNRRLRTDCERRDSGGIGSSRFGWMPEDCHYDAVWVAIQLLD